MMATQTKGVLEAEVARMGKGWQGLAAKVWSVLRVDWRFMTFDLFVNSILGSSLVPRPARTLGYRVVGADVRCLNVYPGVRMYLRHGNLLSVGRGTLLNHGVVIEANAPVRIGTGAMLGPDVIILTSHHDRLPDGRLSPEVTPRGVTVGDGAWLGARSVICPGITIGPRVTIAAGAVVNQDCPEPGATYGGVPARRLK